MHSLDTQWRGTAPTGHGRRAGSGSTRRSAARSSVPQCRREVRRSDGYLARDDHALDILGPLVDLADLLIAIISLHRIIPEIAVAAKQLDGLPANRFRSEEHTSELQSLMRISYAVFCLKQKNTNHNLFHTYRNTQ